MKSTRLRRVILDRKKKLKRLVKALEARDISPKLRKIEVEGATNLEVIDRISDQIEDKIGAVADRQFVPCFGDGGLNVFHNALLANLNGDQLDHPIVICDGGTMSNLAHTLNTADPNVAAGVVSGDIPFDVKNLRIREAVITIFGSDGKAFETMTVPWTNSVGLKISGDIMASWESHPRTRHPLVNLVHSTWQVVKDTVKNHVANGNNGPIEGHSVTTLQNIGFFKFGSRYTNFEGDEFYHQAFQSNGGWDAMKKIVVYTAIAHHPIINEWLWTNIPKDQGKVCFSDILEIISQIEPQPVTNPKFYTDIRYPNLHLDGFPVRLGEMGLKKGGDAEIELRSTDKSIPVARVSV